MDNSVKEVVMIGAGPSALAAAIYTTREDIDTTLYEKSAIGGLAAITDIVDNYPGFPEGIDEALFAGFLRGKPTEFVKGRSINISVPANAEFIFEYDTFRYSVSHFSDHTLQFEEA